MYRLVTERNCNPTPRIVTGHENNRLHTGVLGSGLVKNASGSCYRLTGQNTGSSEFTQEH
ncbi:MAG: hypothetical protein Q4A63_03385 [Butyricicoccus pullicaecorum]|nr:hypothetical protein [Butyricicoccus pullicaecorum]MDO4668840.1 hypothetical protein [Butyricicoccus pullicaecorum]